MKKVGGGLPEILRKVHNSVQNYYKCNLTLYLLKFYSFFISCDLIQACIKENSQSKCISYALALLFMLSFHTKTADATAFSSTQTKNRSVLFQHILDKLVKIDFAPLGLCSN